MLPRKGNSKSLKSEIVGGIKQEVNSFVHNTLRELGIDYENREHNDIFYNQGSTITPLEVSGRILRNITRTNQYYSEFYPYQGIEYHQMRNCNKWFVPKTSSLIDYLPEFDVFDNELGK